MKKRIAAIGIALVMCFSVITFTGCNNPPPDCQVKQLFILAQENGFEGTFEEWLQAIVSSSWQGGQTPHIGENGNWFIGETDTGVRATGKSAFELWQMQPGNEGKSLDDFFAWLRYVPAPQTFTFGVYHADLRGFANAGMFYGVFSNWETLERTGLNPGRAFNSVGYYNPHGYFLEGTTNSVGNVIWRIYSSKATTAVLHMSLGTIIPNADVTMHSGAGGGGNIITLNGEPIEYGLDTPINLPRRVIGDVRDEYEFMTVTMPFAQFEMATVNLVAGLNTITFSVSRNHWDGLINPRPKVFWEANPWGVAIENIQLITNATLAWYSGMGGPRDCNLDNWYSEVLWSPRPATSPRPSLALPKI